MFGSRKETPTLDQRCHAVIATGFGTCDHCGATCVSVERLANGIIRCAGTCK